MKKRHVIFDFDGTITDSFGSCSRSLLAAAKKNSLPADETVLATISEYYGLPTTELLNLCWPGQNHAVFEQSILDANAAGHTPLFPGVENLFLTLQKAGIGMSIFTGRQTTGIWPVLKDFAIDKFFSRVVTRDDVKVGKPNPEGLNLIIEPLLAAGMKKEEILFVGDNRVDYECARNAGLDFVAVTEAENVTRDRFSSLGLPEENILNSLTELGAWLSK